MGCCASNEKTKGGKGGIKMERLSRKWKDELNGLRTEEAATLRQIYGSKISDQKLVHLRDVSDKPV